MVLIRGVHTTEIANLPSILATGLEPRLPRLHNYPGSDFACQPKGVYISLDDSRESFYRPGDAIGDPAVTPSGRRWTDLSNIHIIVHFCGPLQMDNFFLAAGAFVDHIPPSALFPCYGNPFKACPDQLELDA